MTDAELKDRSETRSDANIRFYGVHHLALNTEDMKMTVDFYAGVLGMRLEIGQQLFADAVHMRLRLDAWGTCAQGLADNLRPTGEAVWFQRQADVVGDRLGAVGIDDEQGAVHGTLLYARPAFCMRSR